MVSVAEACEILDNMRIPITASDRKKGIYPYYGANGVQDYVDDYIFDDELVLLAEDGGHFGSKEKPIAYRVSGKCWVNNHAHVLKPKANLNVDYLCYSIMFYDVMPLISGTTRAKLNKAAISKMIIPLPPLHVQQKIADILDRANALIEKRKSQIEKLDLLVKSQFIEMFGDPVTNPKGWEYTKLGNICDITSSKRIFESEYVLSGVPFFRTKEIVELSKGSKITTELYISEARYLEIKEKFEIPKIGDLLVSAVGTIGVIWIVDTAEPFYFKDGNLIWLKCGQQSNPTFLEHLLTKLIDFYKSDISAGSAYSALTIAKLKEMNTHNPPIDIQKQFADFVERVEIQKFELKKSLELMELNYRSLMQKCFGERQNG